jgi:hypothetical protein
LLKTGDKPKSEAPIFKIQSAWTALDEAKPATINERVRIRFCFSMLGLPFVINKCIRRSTKHFDMFGLNRLVLAIEEFQSHRFLKLFVPIEIQFLEVQLGNPHDFAGNLIVLEELILQIVDADFLGALRLRDRLHDVDRILGVVSRHCGFERGK